jgi:hypothetical protein
VDGQCVHTTGKFGGKRHIDQTITLEPALSGERLRYDIHPEMTLPAGTVARVALVPVRLIDDAQAFRPESFGQLPCDEVVGSHRREQKRFVKLAAGAFWSA